MKCPQHPKYQAIRRPNARCLACWAMFLEKHEPHSDLTDVTLSIVNRLEKIEQSVCWMPRD
ncbi:MAG: hypothetical protein ACYTEQ_24210 [Planctomycetota bacterium]|jgi:hypothetical protein